MVDAARSDDLLTFLHAMVVADGAPAGFKGTVCIGVRDLDKDLWWQVALGGDPQPKFVQRPGENVDATFLMGEAESHAMMTGEDLPDSPLLFVEGDKDLLAKFLNRYIKPQSMLGLRASLNR